MSDIERGRVAAVRSEVMAPLGLDLLIAYADDPLFPGAVRYLTAFDIYAMYAVAAVPRQGDVVLAFGLHHSAYLVRVKDATAADHFVGARVPGAAVAELLSEMNLERRPRVGIVGGGAMFGAIDRDLQKALIGADLVEADEAFWRVAAPLDTAGAADLGRGVRIAALALDAAVRSFSGGGTLGAIAADASDAARRAGADVVNRELVQIRAAAGPPIEPALSLAAGSADASGSAVAVDVALSYRGLRAVAGRTLLAPSAAIDRGEALARVEAAHRQILAGLRAGATGAEFHAHATRILKTAGLPPPPAEIGHGIGFDVRQAPNLAAGESRTIKAGSAVVVRTAAMIKPLGTVHLADTIIV